MGKPARPLAERFEEKVMPEPNSGCWLWVGTLSDKGYGRLSVPGRPGGAIRAHRLAYELNRGPIPIGLEPDHKCRIRSCVNPWHLELVTHQENVIRGLAAETMRARGAAVTHCPKGHAYAEHGYLKLGGRKKSMCRSCRECDRVRARRTR